MQCCLISSKWRQRSQKCLVERRRQATHVSHAIRIFQVTKKLDKKALGRKIAFAASSLTRRDLYSLTLLTFCVDFSANQKRGSLINKRFVKVHGMRVTFDKRQTLENHVKTFNAFASSSGSDIDSISFPNKFYFAMSDSASVCHRQSRATMV